MKKKKKSKKKYITPKLVKYGSVTECTKGKDHKHNPDYDQIGWYR